jgi:PAS domain S-box-containing protein
MEDQARQLSAKLSQAEEWWAREEALRVKAEQDLHMARGDLLEVFDNQLVGLYWVAPEGTITDANKAELELLGYSEQEYIGHHIAEFYVDQEVAAEVIGKVQRGESIAQEARLRSHDGSMRYVLMNSKPPAAGGVSARTLFVACDVTERKRIESELAQLLAREHAMRAMAEDAEIRYHNLVHGLDAIVWEADAADFRFLFVSRRGEAILGYPVQRWLGDPDFWASIIHPDDRQQAVEQCRRTASEGEDQELEYRAITADGRIVWINDKVYVVRDKEGRPSKLRGLMVDITDRKLAENERAQLLLREQAAREEAERSAEAVRRLQNLSDTALSPVSLDELLREMLARIRELLATDSAVLLLVSDDGRELAGRATSGIGQNELESRVPFGHGVAGRIAAERTPLIVRDLSVVEPATQFLRGRAHSLIGAPLMIGDRVIGVVHTHTLNARDFTDEDVKLLQLAADRVALAIERVRLYEAEQNARVEAETANRIKDEFLATLSHELRSPLNAILGWVVLVRQGKLDDEATARALETIEFSARSQNRMINDLLDVSRIITGKLQLNVHPLQPARVVESALEALRPAAEAKMMALKVELDSEAGPISADPDRLQQIVWNLLSNAIKFTPKGGQVGVSLRRVDSSVEISVSDTGAGIDPTFLPFVFERFRQADGSSRRKQGGLGLGLAIVRHLAESHGGTVSAKSDGEGKGATFVVRLPLSTGRPITGPLAMARVGCSHIPGFQLDALRILIVDDEPLARELVSRILAEERADVKTAASVAEALSILSGWIPDVLISDIEMPEADGYSLISEVRALPDRRAQVPILALTAYARAEDKSRAIAAGFQMHIPKPVEPGHLVSAVASVASGYREPAEEAPGASGSRFSEPRTDLKEKPEASFGSEGQRSH